MDINTFWQRLQYPHKKSALRYLLKCPSLFRIMFAKSSPTYFAITMQKMANENFLDCLRHLLPGMFAEYLSQREYRDKDGIPILLYTLVRKLKPDVCVETGVSYGVSSAFILAAMHENKKGRLYSIDLPPYEAAIKTDERDMQNLHTLSDGQIHRYQKGQKVGDFVPDFLRERWTLILGDARKELPELLSKLGKFSLFLHDSLHTYEHMTFEYQTAWPYLEKNGLLLSHDILWNHAFLEFCHERRAKPIIYHSFGMIKKT